jgi:excisionase family DNA binding protein
VETFRGGSSKLSSTTTQLHDTLGTLPGRAWSGLFSPGGAAADFGTAFAVRRPPLWPPGGLAGSVDFESDPMYLALFPDRWGAEEMHDENHIEIERLLSPEDVARICGLSRRAVYRAIARGELRAARLCNRLRIHPVELERWIAGETRGASPPPPRRVRRRVVGAKGGLRALLDEGAEG